jgi:hypothetical protein
VNFAVAGGTLLKGIVGPKTMRLLAILIRDIYIYWLVVSTPLKNISQLGLSFPIYGKIKTCSKPPDSICVCDYIYIYIDYWLYIFQVLGPPLPSHPWSWYPLTPPGGCGLGWEGVANAVWRIYDSCCIQTNGKFVLYGSTCVCTVVHR